MYKINIFKLMVFNQTNYRFYGLKTIIMRAQAWLLRPGRPRRLRPPAGTYRRPPAPALLHYGS